jgi:transposase
MRSRVEQFENIRRQHRDEGASIRELARRHGVHRRTVRQALESAVPPARKTSERQAPALESAVPPARKTSERQAPALGEHEAVIRQWLVADQQAPPKQRHTARRVWQRLCEERGAQVAESTVRAFVAKVKAELARDLGKVTIPQEHAPGDTHQRQTLVELVADADWWAHTITPAQVLSQIGTRSHPTSSRFRGKNSTMPHELPGSI